MGYLAGIVSPNIYYRNIQYLMVGLDNVMVRTLFNKASNPGSNYCPHDRFSFKY